MAKKYALNPALEVIKISENKLNFIFPQNSFSLFDASGVTIEIVNAAKTGLDVRGFVIETSNRFLAPIVEAAVETLAEKKVLVDAESVSKIDSSLYFIQLPIVGNKLAPEEVSNPANWQIFIHGDNALADALGDAAKKFGARVTKADDTTAFQSTPLSIVIGAAQNENIEPFRKLNRRAIDASIPALYVWLDRHIVRCGPLVLPRATACYECYFHRVRASRRFVAEFDARCTGNSTVTAPRPSQLSLQWASAVTLSQVLGYMTGVSQDLHLGALREIDTLRSEVRASHLLRLPRCSVCGTGSSQRAPLAETFQHALMRQGGTL